MSRNSGSGAGVVPEWCPVPDDGSRHRSSADIYIYVKEF